MGKSLLVSGGVVFFLAVCSVLNPYEKINELRHGMEQQKIQIDGLTQQIKALSDAAGVKFEDVPASPSLASTSSSASSVRRAAIAPAPPAASAKDKSKMTISELELAFHQERYNQLQDAPENDMLVWNASDRLPDIWTGKNGKEYKGGHRIYDRLLDHFDYCEVYTREDTLPADKKCDIILARGDKYRMGGLCHAAYVVNRHRQQHNVSLPHVLLFSFHEDFGGMNKPIDQKFKCQGAWDYINHPDTIALFTVQTHYTDHPKIHSIALGYRFLKHGSAIYKSLHSHTPKDSVNKKKKVMFNNNISHNRAQRLATLQTLQKNFANTDSPVENTFSRGNSLANYYEEMTQTQFIASPTGLGGDCYRNYEAIFNGCIPIIEMEKNKADGMTREQDGWRRVFDDMPAVFVRDWEEVTPEFVQKEYRRVLEGGPYNFKKTLRSWWIQHIHNLVKNHVPSY